MSQMFSRTFLSLSRSRSLHPPPSSLLPSFLSELPPSLSYTTNPYALASHSRDEGNHTPSPHLPLLVCFPTSTSEVLSIIRLANAHSINVVPFGVGTSLEGHVHPLSPLSLTLSLTRMSSVVSTSSVPSGFVTVQPGITRSSLNEHLRSTGYEFKIDPGADATIGGMAATNASGTRAVKYGTMRENVKGMTVVTGGGKVLKLGSESKKSSAGYDLRGMFVGSEGTLGVITEVTVRVEPVCGSVTGGVVAFKSVDDAMDAARGILAQGANTVSKMELLDSSSVEAYNRRNNNPGGALGAGHQLPTDGPALFFEFEGVSDEGVEETRRIAEEVCWDAGCVSFEASSDPKVSKELWKARHMMYYSCLHMREGSYGAVTTDACVGIQHLAGILTETREDIDRNGVLACVVGHVGDGNFHVLFPLVQTDGEEYREKIQGINARLIESTLRVGGTCTGEHGVGRGKRGFLKDQVGGEVLEAMRMVKGVFDPNGVMNVGKII